MTAHDPAACHECGKETCVASLSGGLLDRLDCARAKSARLRAIADSLGEALRLEGANVEQIDLVVRQMEQCASPVAHGWAKLLRPWVDGAKNAGGSEALAAWRKARP